MEKIMFFKCLMGNVRQKDCTKLRNKNMAALNSTRRDFLKAVGLGAVSLVVPGCSNSPRHPADDKARKPNQPLNRTDEQQADTEPADLKKYRQQLEAFRSEFRAVELADVKFFLFGMGNRSKWLYKDGVLKNALTGSERMRRPVKSQNIIPNGYRVELKTADNRNILIYENETGVYIKENEKITRLEGTNSPVKLSDFRGNKYSEILKVLHQEILINIVDSRPLPNFFVYSKPWRRDSAMMAMCLEKTGNLNIIGEWVLGLNEAYDRNNGQKQGKPESEADNLGQTLYLLSLFTDKSHRLVQKILDELPKYEVKDEHGFYIRGRSDFQYVPVYQTKWLKFGLKQLGIDDPYTIPDIPDNYSSLFWWDYKDKHVEEAGWVNDQYPYIGWARDHFYKRKGNPISNRDYPLTWEKGASQADYPKLKIIDPIYSEAETSAPHTWHAAEVFLYLLDL